MTRIGRLGLFLLPFMLLMAGCGGGDGSDEASRSAAADRQLATQEDTPPTTEGRAAIPPKGPDAVEGLKIAPYFDEAGTQTDLAVAAGELFTIYICIDHPGYDMAAAQWRLLLPEGITVVGEIKVIEHALSIGSYKDTFAMTYPCESGGKTMNIYKYNCIAAPDFAGGVVETVKAVSAKGESAQPAFIGFVTCGGVPDQVPAYGGSATLRLK